MALCLLLCDVIKAIAVTAYGGNEIPESSKSHGRSLVENRIGQEEEHPLHLNSPQIVNNPVAEQRREFIHCRKSVNIRGRAAVDGREERPPCVTLDGQGGVRIGEKRIVESPIQVRSQYSVADLMV
jgi:hypothetical protein